MRVDHPLLRYGFDRLDFPIRFVYSQVPFAHRLLFWKLYSSSFEQLDSRFARVQAKLDALNISVKDRVCLELGPGNSLINAYNLLESGARKVLLVDKFPRSTATPRQREYFLQERDYARGKFGSASLGYVSDSGCDPKFIEWIVGDIADTRLNTPVEFVYSNSVLEHVRRLSDTLGSLERAMLGGAVAYHAIDLRDHYNFASPFRFYRYSEFVWNSLLTKEGVSFTNRLRVDDYEAEFRQLGLETVDLETEQFALCKSDLAEPFREKSHAVLSTGLASFVLRKPLP